MPMETIARPRLARFLHHGGMTVLHDTIRNFTLEDWIEPLCRLALVILLLATLSRFV